MQAKETVDLAQEQRGHQDVRAEAAVGNGQVVGLKMVQQFIEQTQFMLVFVAFGVIEQDAGAQAEDADDLHQRKAAAGFLRAGLGIGPLVFGRVGQSEGGAVDDFWAQAIPELLDLRQHLLGAVGHGVANALENIQGHAETGLAVGTGAFIDAAEVVETEQGLDLPDDFTARAGGIEDLEKETKKSASHRIDAVAAVGALVGLG